MVVNGLLKDSVSIVGLIGGLTCDRVSNTW